jgi:5'(3')-deoxyribonucleotidase
MNKVIYIDMDDTICDYLKQHGKEYHEKINQYPQSRVGFFKELEEIPQAIVVIQELARMGNVIYFLTRPSVYNIHSYTEKAEWIKEHFGFNWLTKLILCCDKSLLKGDYLIDDATRDGQLQFEGEFIEFGKTFKDWNEILEYFKTLNK